MAQLNGWLGARFGLRRLVLGAVLGFALAMVTLLALFAAGIDRLEVMIAFLFIGYGFLGLVLPTTSVLALEEHGAIAGTASAFIGTVQFVTGAVIMLFVGSFLNGTALPMIAGIAACAAASLALAQVTLRNSEPESSPVEAAAE